MKANELRIANLVDLNGREILIESLNRMDNTINDNPSDIFQPIPLTEEWLVKFGFYEKYKSAGNKWTKKAESVNAGCELMDPEDEETGKLTGNFYYPNWGTDIKYVHQLQNLYFALTGEELTWKK